MRKKKRIDRGTTVKQCCFANSTAQGCIVIKKSSKLIGDIKAPPSKSYTIRTVMIGSMNGKVKITNPLYSDDALATIDACRELGAIIKKKNNYLKIKGVYGIPCPKGGRINVGESGTLLRFILPILTLAKGTFRVCGQGTLLGRSNKTIVDVLRSWGIDIIGEGKEHKLPIRIKGKGGIEGGKTYVSGQSGSQTISSLLIVAPFAKKDTTIIIKDKLVSRPYVDITIDVLKQTGIKVEREGYKKFYVKCGQKFKTQKEYKVHGDYSSSANLLAMACLLPSDIMVTDLTDDKQGDKKMIDILRKMGARIKRLKNALRVKGPFELKGIDIDCGDTPDLVPILTVLGCFAKGEMRIRNISHLAHKETNRVTAPAGELMKLGANISTTRNGLTIKHSCLKSGHVSSCNDHRIAMALTVAGLKIGDVRIAGVDSISKSYPNFLRDIKSIGAKFKIV